MTALRTSLQHRPLLEREQCNGGRIVTPRLKVAAKRAYPEYVVIAMHDPALDDFDREMAHRLAEKTGIAG